MFSFFKIAVFRNSFVFPCELPKICCPLKPGQQRKLSCGTFFALNKEVQNALTKLINSQRELKWWLINNHILWSWLSKSIGQHKNIRLINCKQLLNIFLLVAYLHNSVCKTLYCFIKWFFINLDIIHYNINLRLLAYLIS